MNDLYCLETHVWMAHIGAVGDLLGRVSGKRCGYPVAASLGCRPPFRPRTAFGRFFRLGHLNPESCMKAGRFQILVDDPLPRICDDIGQL